MKKIITLIVIILSLSLIFAGCTEEEEKTAEQLLLEEVDLVIDLYEQAYLTQDAYLLENNVTDMMVINDEDIMKEDFLVVLNYNLGEHYSEIEEYELQERDYEIFDDSTKVAVIAKEFMVMDAEPFSFDGVFADIIVYLENVDGNWKIYKISVYEISHH
jgi:hypothetical protein